MDRMVIAPWLSGGMFVGMLLLFLLGRRLSGQRPGGDNGFGAIAGAIYGLFSLLIAFTFQGAANRLDTHRQMIGAEANDIATAYFRLDLLAPASREELRERMRRYLDSRIAVYKKLPDIDSAKAELASSVKLRDEIWKLAIPASTQPGGHVDAGKLLLPALGNMADVADNRTLLAQLHPPLAIAVMLCCLGLASAFFMGWSLGAKRAGSWIHVVGYSFITACMIFLIADLEYPHYGIIRSPTFDQVLVDLRQEMNNPR